MAFSPRQETLTREAESDVARSLGLGYERLSPGPGHSPGQVRESQRARIHKAMVDLVAQRGYANVTVRGLTQTSKVSTRSFYLHFPDIEECFASTYSTIMRWVAERLTASTAEHGMPEAGLRAWIQSLIDITVEYPGLAQLVTIDAYDGGPAMLREVSAATAEIDDRLANRGDAMPLPLAQGLFAGIEWVIGSHLLEHRQADLLSSADELVAWALRVWSGPAVVVPEAPTKRLGAGSTAMPVRDELGLAVLRGVGGDRGRLLEAVARLSLAHEYWSLTAERVWSEAGVSKRAFYGLFDDLADCYLEAIERVSVVAAARAQRETMMVRRWEDRVEMLSDRVCRKIAINPLLGRLGVTGILAPGTAGLRRRKHLVDALAYWLRTQSPQRDHGTELGAAASVAASWRVIETGLGSGFDCRVAAPFVAKFILGASPRITRRKPKQRSSDKTKYSKG